MMRVPVTASHVVAVGPLGQTSNKKRQKNKETGNQEVKRKTECIGLGAQVFVCAHTQVSLHRAVTGSLTHRRHGKQQPGCGMCQGTRGQREGLSPAWLWRTLVPTASSDPALSGKGPPIHLMNDEVMLVAQQRRECDLAAVPTPNVELCRYLLEPVLWKRDGPSGPQAQGAFEL